MANFFDQFDDGPDPAGQRYATAIGNIESAADGGYRAVGPVTKRGDRALGKYQVMASNVRPWSREVLGQEVTPQQFMMSPELQDYIFQAKFGSYAKKYGPQGAARAWFAGEGGMNDPGRHDQLGTTVAEYGRRFNREMGFAAKPKARTDVPPVIATGHAAPAPSAGGNFFDQFDGEFDGAAPQPAASNSPTSGRPRVVIDTNKIDQTAQAAVGADGPDRGALDAAARGAAQGLTANFSDEIRGLIEA